MSEPGVSIKLSGWIKTNSTGLDHLLNFYNSLAKHRDINVLVDFSDLKWIDANMTALLNALEYKLAKENNITLVTDMDYLAQNFSVLFRNGGVVTEGIKIFTEPPQILMTSLLMSEIINRLLRDVYFADFKAKNPYVPGINEPRAFKEIYRKNARYRTDNRIIFADIKAYQPYIKLIDDNFSGYRLKDVINDNTTGLDFNDYVYAKLAKKHHATIVTNDIDFSGLSLNILTANQRLIRQFTGK